MNSARDTWSLRMLKKEKIRTVHIAGLETNDCVLATAFDAFDRGLQTAVLEEACASKSKTLYRGALLILRKLHLTNHSLD